MPGLITGIEERIRGMTLLFENIQRREQANAEEVFDIHHLLTVIIL